MKNIILLCGLLLIVSCADISNSSSVSDENQAKFEQQIESFRTFANGFNAENMDLTMSVVSESVQWSPPYYNGGQLLSYEDFQLAVKGYFDNFDNLEFLEGEGPNMNPDADPNANSAYWSGSLYSSATPSSEPNGLRVYGVWKWKHTESGAEGGNKWYGLINFGDDGKITGFSDWMDVNGMTVQIEKYLESSKN
jgi:hypothetical protein|tara:strand:- start:511 stop:1092 length:582 start_codon:yes stop_codon:yes gene_type:complete